MPVMNGYEAATRIRQMEDKALSSIPILAMTANAFEEDKKEALKCGMNGHIAKPIDVGEHGAAHGLRGGRIRHAHRGSIAAAPVIRRKRYSVCGDPGLDRRRCHPDSKLLLYGAQATDGRGALHGRSAFHGRKAFHGRLVQHPVQCLQQGVHIDRLCNVAVHAAFQGLFFILLESAMSSASMPCPASAGRNQARIHLPKPSMAAMMPTEVMMAIPVPTPMPLAWFLPADAGQGMEALDIAYRYLSIMAVFLPVLYILHVTGSHDAHGGDDGDSRPHPHASPDPAYLTRAQVLSGIGGHGIAVGGGGHLQDSVQLVGCPSWRYSCLCCISSM